MGSRGQVRFADLEAMLRHCAPGYELRQKPHNTWVLFRGLTYRGLPKYVEIDIGHVRKMIRHLGIDMACASGVLPILK